MKIDCTFIDEEYLKKAEIEICDYMDENDKKLDNYMDYVVFDNVDESIVLKGKRNPHTKTKKKNNIARSENTKTTSAYKIDVRDKLPITYKSDVSSIINEDSCNSYDREKSLQIQDKLAVDGLKNIEGNQGTIEDSTEVEHETLTQETSKDIEEDTTPGYEEVVDTTNISESSMEVEMLEDDYENHEVIEMNGSEYVMLGEMLYKIVKE